MRVVVFGAIRSVHTPELHTRIPLALHTHAHACTRIRGLRRLSPIPRQDPTPLMRLSVPFPPPPATLVYPPPHLRWHCRGVRAACHGNTGRKRGKKWVWGHPPESLFAVRCTTWLFLLFQPSWAESSNFKH